MAKAAHPRHWCICLIFILLLCRSGSAFSWVPSKDIDLDSDTVSLGLKPGVDLSQMAHPVPEVHRKVRDYVKRLEIAPTCTRKAAFGLISECAKFTTSQGLQDLDRIKTIYAARLAMCELHDAGFVAPPDCDHIALEGISKNTWSFQRDPRVAVNRCVKALEMRPQSWTSYSNNRQNALLICQASRVESEREEMLSLFSKLARNNEDSDQRLGASLRFADEQLEKQRASAAELRQFTEVLSQQMQREADEARDVVSKLSEELQMLGPNVADALAAVLRRTTDDVQHLADTFKSAESDVASFAADLRMTGKEAALQYQGDLRTNAAIALDLQQGLSKLHEQQAGLDQQMEQLHEALRVMSEQHDQTATAILQKSQSALAQLTSLEHSTANMMNMFDTLLSYGDALKKLGHRFSDFWLVISVLLLLRPIIDARGWRLNITLSVVLTFTWTIFNASLQTSALPLGHVITPFNLIILPMAVFGFGRLFSLTSGRLLLRLPWSANCQQSFMSDCQNLPLVFQYYDPATGAFSDIPSHLLETSSE